MPRSLPEMKSFPDECPTCHARAGFPYRVATDANRQDCVRLDMRCRDCKSEWHLERPNGPSGPTPVDAAHAI